MNYKLYEVGGRVRDKFLGVESKDVDYSVVIEPNEMWGDDIKIILGLFVNHIESQGFKVFLVTPEALTVRAKFPESHKYSGVADFVIARKEIGYTHHSRCPIVTLGTLQDDLERRDFTINAMAFDDSDNLLDPFNGKQDLKDGILRTPKDSAISLHNDPLRVLRAMRFSITKNLLWSDSLVEAIKLFDHFRMTLVSVERIREELLKMFRFDTKRTMNMLFWLKNNNPELYLTLFSKGLWLEPTIKN